MVYFEDGLEEVLLFKLIDYFYDFVVFKLFKKDWVFIEEV